MIESVSDRTVVSSQAKTRDPVSCLRKVPRRKNCSLQSRSRNSSVEIISKFRCPGCRSHRASVIVQSASNAISDVPGCAICSVRSPMACSSDNGGGVADDSTVYLRNTLFILTLLISVPGRANAAARTNGDRVPCGIWRAPARLPAQMRRVRHRSDKRCRFDVDQVGP